MRLELKCGDVFKRIKEIQDESVDLVVTSPPYWGLRDYGVEGQLGLEPSMEAYLDNMMKWVQEVWRVLKPTGSFVLNIGDCFIGGGRGARDMRPGETEVMNATNIHVPKPPNWSELKNFSIYKPKQFLSVSSFAYCRIVSEFRFICRGEHIWLKPNIPSPIRSRLKHSHEKLFWFVKDADKYYFDPKPWMKPIANSSKNIVNYPADYSKNTQGSRTRRLEPGLCGPETIEHSWRIVPVGARQNGFELSGREASEHVAPFPEELIRPYIKSMCPPEGTVLDPFLGSGTTMRVAMEEGRNCIGIELNPAYVEYAKKRLNWGAGLGVEYIEG
jgi:DNA modification methylase